MADTLNNDEMSEWYVCGTQDGRLLITHEACGYQELRKDRLSMKFSAIADLLLAHECEQEDPSIAGTLLREAAE